MSLWETILTAVVVTVAVDLVVVAAALLCARRALRGMIGGASMFLPTPVYGAGKPYDRTEVTADG